jgi:hypothetical protein
LRTAHDGYPARNGNFNANKLKSSMSSKAVATLAIRQPALLHSIAGDFKTSNDILCFTDLKPVRADY